MHLSYFGVQNIVLEQQGRVNLKIYYFYQTISIYYYTNIILMLELFEEETQVKDKNIWAGANLEANEDNGSSFLDSIKNNKSI